MDKLELRRPLNLTRAYHEKKRKEETYNANAPFLNPKSLSVRRQEEMPLLRKWNLSPVSLVAICCVLLALLWLMLFSP
jgi:hypothetical protein